MHPTESRTRHTGTVARAGLLLATCVSVLVAPVPAGAQQAWAARDEPLFEPVDALYAAGFLVGTAALAPLDLAVAEAIQDDRLQTDRVLGIGAGALRLLGYPAPLVVSAGLWVGGWATHDRTLAGIGLHTAEAVILSTGVTYAGKALIGRARPRLDTGDPFDFGFLRGWGNGDYRSFPSGHTTSAFAAAAALTTELSIHEPGVKAWAAVVLYGMASLVGVSRLYHNEHWASDVMAGAAVGSFGGWKIVRWMHNHPGNELDRLLLPEAHGRARSQPVLLMWSVPVD